MRITSGIVNSAQKVVIYGPEGIGKSTLASKFPMPLFIDTEGSTKKLNVNRFEDKPSSWQMLKAQVEYVISNPTVCKTLVVDTIDWAEQLCVDEVCSSAGKKGIEDFGYGNGYVYEKEEFARFLVLLDRVIDVNVNVVLTAHAHIRKFEQPDEIGSYDRWELKLGKKTGSQISPLVKEWADAVFFCNYKTYAVSADDKGKKFKAQGGKRVIYTTHHPCWDAKNRIGLPPEIPMEFEAFSQILCDNVTSVKESVKTVEHADFTEIVDEEEIGADTIEKMKQSTYSEMIGEGSDNIPKAVKDLMNIDGITEEEIRSVVFARGMYPKDTPISSYEADFINGWLIPFWPNIVQYTKENLR